ncbi:hypothetical protein KKH50_04685 [Patescibacteria group bacterium]|nr:hypothetical protein [Patescibacteria group bacterium]
MDYKDLTIDASSLGEAWLKSLAIVLKHGVYITDGPVNLIEVCNLYVRIHSICNEDPVIKKYADKERIELMRLKYYSCEVVHNYKVSYGKLLYDNMGVNQIEWVINRIKNKLETKSATISFHHPGNEDLICLSLLDFKLRNRSLSMTAVYRSQNVFGSQPGNILVLREVQEYVARQVGVDSGEFNLVILSAHIYEDDIEKATKTVEEGNIGVKSVDQLLLKEGKKGRVHFS